MVVGLTGEMQVSDTNMEDFLVEIMRKVEVEFIAKEEEVDLHGLIAPKLAELLKYCSEQQCKVGSSEEPLNTCISSWQYPRLCEVSLSHSFNFPISRLC